MSPRRRNLSRPIAIGCAGILLAAVAFRFVGIEGAPEPVLEPAMPAHESAAPALESPPVVEASIPDREAAATDGAVPTADGPFAPDSIRGWIEVESEQPLPPDARVVAVPRDARIDWKELAEAVRSDASDRIERLGARSATVTQSRTFHLTGVPSGVPIELAVTGGGLVIRHPADGMVTAGDDHVRLRCSYGAACLVHAVDEKGAVVRPFQRSTLGSGRVETTVTGSARLHSTRSASTRLAGLDDLERMRVDGAHAFLAITPDRAAGGVPLEVAHRLPGFAPSSASFLLTPLDEAILVYRLDLRRVGPARGALDVVFVADRPGQIPDGTLSLEPIADGEPTDFAIDRDDTWPSLERRRFENLACGTYEVSFWSDTAKEPWPDEEGEPILVTIEPLRAATFDIDVRSLVELEIHLMLPDLANQLGEHETWLRMGPAAAESTRELFTELSVRAQIALTAPRTTIPGVTPGRYTFVLTSPSGLIVEVVDVGQAAHQQIVLDRYLQRTR